MASGQGRKKNTNKKNGGSNKELERESRSSHLPRDSHRDHLLHHLPLSFTFISSLLRFYSLLPSRLFFSLSLSRPIISILIFAEWARSFAIVFFSVFTDQKSKQNDWNESHQSANLISFWFRFVRIICWPYSVHESVPRYQTWQNPKGLDFLKSESIFFSRIDFQSFFFLRKILSKNR